MLGKSSVGKTSLVRAILGEPFDEELKATVGDEKYVVNVPLPSEGTVSLEIWD